MRNQAPLFGDVMRLPLDLVYWNWKKTRYRLRGGRGRCPCQHPSDSGIVGETGCDASVMWNAPERFRWVCPLLVRGEHGCHCSVPAEKVRPFWGRAAAIFLLSALGMYLVAATGLVAVLRATGMEGLGWSDVAWPGSWETISKSRARYFAVRSGRQLQTADFNGAELSLLSALELDPANYEASLFLAHLKQYQQNYPYSDYLFRRLIDRDPARAQQTAIAWHDALLVRQRYPELAELSLHMAATRSDQMWPWIRSALFAVRQGPDASGFVRRNAAQIDALPPAVGAIFRAEDIRRRDTPVAAVKLLLEAGAGPLSRILVREYVEQLLRAGERDQAEVFLRLHAGELSPFDRGFVEMRIDQVSGDAALVRRDFEQLLKLALTPLTRDSLTAWLVEYPDLRSFERLDRIVSEKGNQASIEGAEMWVAAMACGAVNEAAFWADFCATRLKLRVPAIPALNFASDSMADPASIPRIVAIGHLPREVIFSLLRRSAAAKTATAPVRR